MRRTHRLKETAMQIIDIDIRDMERARRRTRSRSSETVQLVEAIESLGKGEALGSAVTDDLPEKKLRSRLAYAAKLAGRRLASPATRRRSCSRWLKDSDGVGGGGPAVDSTAEPLFSASDMASMLNWTWCDGSSPCASSAKSSGWPVSACLGACPQGRRESERISPSTPISPLVGVKIGVRTVLLAFGWWRPD
jgi:hypothetical protein